jgi:photosystem I P700 chlorophyll a apoprotein A2
MLRPIAHAIWDPHFGQPAVEAFTRGGASGPVNISTSGVYQWWYTIGMRTNQDLYIGSVFLGISFSSIFICWMVTFTTKFPTFYYLGLKMLNHV